MKKRLIIGKGAYGTVFKTELNGKEIAIKRMEIAYSIDITEPILMSSLKHPYINNAIQIKNTNKFIYIYQDLAISDLSKYYFYNKLSRSELDMWSDQMFKAISYLHSYDIIHGDIKSSNFLIYKDCIKLCDFTLSRFIIPKEELNTTDFIMNNVENYKNTCTSTHRPLEIWLKYDCNKSTDVWGYGCVLFEMMFREYLFPFKYFNSNLEKILPMFDLFFKNKNEYSKVYNISSPWDSNDAFIQLIKLCLEKNPSKRLRTIYESKNINIENIIFNKIKNKDITKIMVDKLYNNDMSIIPDHLVKKETSILKKINYTLPL